MLCQYQSIVKGSLLPLPNFAAQGETTLSQFSTRFTTRLQEVDSCRCRLPVGYDSHDWTRRQVRFDWRTGGLWLRHDRHSRNDLSGRILPAPVGPTIPSNSPSSSTTIA